MPRIARIVVPGYPHHITQRGNNSQDIFFVDDDRSSYFSILKEYCAEYGLDILSYCLMTNHIHLVAVPQNEESLAKAVGGTHFRYTQYINRMHKRTGHLWEARFYSSALDNKGFWLASKHVELNPVRAKVCRLPWRYKWSSSAAHTGEKDKSELLNLKKWNKMVTVKEWKKELLRGLDLKQINKLRLSTHTGRPLGTDSFLSKLEKLLGRRVRPLPVGRPRKDTDN